MDLKRPLQDGRLAAVAIIIIWCIMAVLVSISNDTHTRNGVSYTNNAIAKPTRETSPSSTQKAGENNLWAGASRELIFCIMKNNVASIADDDTNIVSSSASSAGEKADKQDEQDDLRQNEDVILLAKLIQGEGGGIENINERAAIALTVLYRADNPKWPNSIYDNVYKPYQYEAAPGPDTEYSDACLEAAIKAYSSWKDGSCEDILPRDYVFFFGYGGKNWFYNYDLEIYDFYGQGLPGNIYTAMAQIVPGLASKLNVPNLVADAQTPSEPLTESVINPDLTNLPVDPSLVSVPVDPSMIEVTIDPSLVDASVNPSLATAPVDPSLVDTSSVDAASSGVLETVNDTNVLLSGDSIPSPTNTSE